MTPVPCRRDRYMAALLAFDRSPEVIRATGVAVALALSARADGTRASLSGAMLAQLYGFGATDSTARRHLRTLRDAGWIEQTTQGGRRGNKVYASIYSLSQPSTWVDAQDEVPNRPRLTLQPSTQVDASSPQRGLRATVGPLGLAASSARPALADAFLSTQGRVAAATTPEVIARFRAWSVSIGADPVDIEAGVGELEARNPQPTAEQPPEPPLRAPWDVELAARCESQKSDLPTETAA